MSRSDKASLLRLSNHLLLELHIPAHLVPPDPDDTESTRDDLRSNLACPDMPIQSFHLTYILPTLTATLQGLITSPNNRIAHEIQMRFRSTRTRRRGPINHLLALTGRILPWTCSSHEILPKRRLRQQKMHAKSLMVLNKRNLALRKHLTRHLRARSLTACLIRLWIKRKRSRFLGRRT